MYHIGLYTCNGLKYTSEVQRGAPLGGHHRWENNKRKRAPLRALCRLYCWWVSTILSCVFTLYVSVCVCVHGERRMMMKAAADGVLWGGCTQSCWSASTENIGYKGGGILRSWLTRSFWLLLCHGWWPMFVTLIPRSYGYTAVNAPHTTSKAAAIKLLPPESVPHDHPSIQQLLRHPNNSLASFFFCPDLQHTLRNKSKLLLPV